MDTSDVAENWEDLFDDEYQEDDDKEKIIDKPKDTTHTKQKAQNKKNRKSKIKGDSTTDALNTIKRKLENQRLVEKSDALIADDLFAGCERPEDNDLQEDNEAKYDYDEEDSFEYDDILEMLKSSFLKDVELVADYLNDSIDNGTAKSAAWLRFLEILLRDCIPKLSLKDLATIRNKISSFLQHIRTIGEKKPCGKSRFKLESLDNIKDVETFTEKLASRIRESSAKSNVWLRLFDLILPHVVPKMDIKDLTSFHKNIMSSVQQKCFLQRESVQSKRKPNDIESSVRNYKEEMTMFYGDVTEDEEVYPEYEEYD